MNGVYFETQNLNTYLVYPINKDDKLDSMSVGMLTNNEIPGFSQMIVSQLNDDKFLKYNVTSKISVNDFFSGPVNKKRLLYVFKGIINAVISSEEYMIDSKYIVLDKEFIFTDVSTYETIVICFPIEDENNDQPDFAAFFKTIMFTTQFDQTENCDYVAKIINYLNSSSFSANDFKDLLNNILGEDTAQPAPAVNLTKPQPQVNNQPAMPVQPAVPVDTNPVSKPFQPAGTPNGFTVAPPVKTPAVQQQAAVPAMQNNQQNSFGSMNVPGANNNSQIMQVPSAQKQNAKTGFATPPQNTQQAPQDNTSNEKEISLFYLLQHYNSENAAAYKAQQAAKKKNKNQAQAAKKQQPQTMNNVPNTAVNVPGMAAAPTPVQPQQNQNNVKPTFQSNAPAMQNVPQPIQQTPVQQISFNTNQYMQQQAVPKTSVNQNVVHPQPVTYSTTVQSPDFGGTTVLGARGFGQETTVLGGNAGTVSAVSPYLYRVKNNESIRINKESFIIGKERSFVDYFIADNSAISRSHAKISIKDNKYYITDTNSTNHTYLNGQMIQSSTDVEIRNGDKIRLANEDFEFKVF